MVEELKAVKYKKLIGSAQLQIKKHKSNLINHKSQTIFAAMLIKFAKYIISSPSVDSCPPPDINEFAFIGRSNVGKSSLINMLCNNDRLAKTSGTPGNPTD